MRFPGSKAPLVFKVLKVDPIPPPKIAMAQLVKAKRAENIPVFSWRLVLKMNSDYRIYNWIKQLLFVLVCTGGGCNFGHICGC